MGTRLLSVPFGEPATRALAELVAELRAGDPLAPITLTVPSAAAGTTLRRQLAQGSAGLVNVTVQSLPQLADRLGGPAASGAAAVPPVVVRGHLRRALRALDGPLGRAASSAATEQALERSIAELADLDDDGLAALAARGGTTGDVVRVARAVRAAAPLADPGAVLRAATAAVRAGRAPLGAVGPVVVHLPRRLRPAELDLLVALAERTQLAITVGRVGDERADGPGDELLALLAERLGVTPERIEGAAEAVPTLLVRAPDPAEEAAVAARLVVDAIGRGSRPERIAVCYRVRDPYAALLHEQLDAAGVPHHVPAVGTLAQSVAGRVLLGALDLPDGRFRRADVVAWWRSGPVRDLATGWRVPVARWDRVAREAGVVGGLDQWHQRLAEAAELRRQHLATRPPDDPAALPDLDDHRLRTIAALDAAVAALAERLEPPAEPTWAAWSQWAGALLADALGPDPSPESWPEEERAAHERVRAAVASLARLDGIDAPPDRRVLRHVLARELDRPVRPHGRFGHGVAVGPLVDAVGADLDLVVVVGAAEGQLPPRRSDDPLVPDRHRRGVALAPRARSRDEEARDLQAALAAAPARVLVAPRSDPRAQRERQPAPAFLEAAGARAGRLVASGELRHLRREPWFVDVESFEWWPGGGRPELVVADVDLAALLDEHRSGRPVSASAPALADPGLARGLEAAAARRSGAFDGWSGNVGSAPAGDRPDLLAGFDTPRSPTGLERYAACPFRFFLGNVLGVVALDDPTELDTLSGRDVGTLVHAVLERFVAEAGIAAAKAPDDAWSEAERARLLAIAEEEAAHVVAAGRTGRPLLWELQWEGLRRQLLGILDEDERLRRAGRMVPIAVEHRFGTDESEPVTLDLGDGRTVSFKGIIDRVDRSEDGRRLLVVDYKTGSDRGYDVDEDLTARGQRLQLAIYALAARRDHPGAEEVEARYWFVGPGGRVKLRGGVFDPAAEARFRDVVGTILGGIGAGRFPANPGEEEWAWGRYVHDHCRYCEYDRVCPTTRGWSWQQAKAVPELADYVALAEAELELGPEPVDGGEP